MLTINGKPVKEQPFKSLEDGVKRWIEDPVFFEDINCTLAVIRLPDRSCWLPPRPGSNFYAGQELTALILAHHPDFEVVDETDDGGLSKQHTVFINVESLDARKAFCVVCGFIDLTQAGAN